MKAKVWFPLHHLSNWVAIAVILLGTAACAVPATPAGPKPAAPTQASSSAPATAAPVATQAPATKEPVASGPKGTLTYGSPMDPEFLDPLMSLSFFNYMVSYTMFDTLVTLDDTGKPVPSLAESWERISPTQWSFKLRKGVKFHDGTPFTSASVKASLDHVVDPAVKSRQAAIWGDYDHTETPDENTAVIFTKKPMGTLFANLSLTFMIEANPTKPLDKNPIGTGPFKFVEWIKDTRYVVEANANYWRGAPKLQQIIFRTIPETAARVSALERKEIDLTELVPPEEFARLEKAGIKLVHQPTLSMIQMWLGTSGPLADVKVRQAMNLAIDRQSLTKDLLSGEGVPATGCVAPGVVGYAPMSPAVKYDPDKAKDLLKQAGYASGLDLELIFPQGMYAKDKEINELVAAELAKVGIRVKVTQQDQALWVKELLAMRWQAETLVIGTVTGDADYNTRRLWLGANNRIFYKNAKLDELLQAQAAETDAAKRGQLLKDACQIVWDDAAFLFLYDEVRTYGATTRVKNLVTHPSTMIFFQDVSVD